MDKKAVIHIYMKYYSAIKRNAFESVLMRWMNLDLTLLSQPCRDPAVGVRNGEEA